jgi:hypothetical protein
MLTHFSLLSAACVLAYVFYLAGEALWRWGEKNNLLKEFWDWLGSIFYK